MAREYNINRTCKNLAFTWLKWVYLASVVAVLELVFWRNWVGFKGLLDAYMFRTAAFAHFGSVTSSAGFLEWYFVLVLGNTAVMACAQKMGMEIQKTYCGVLLAGYFAVVFGIYFFGLPQWYLFFSFFWMLGNLFHDKKIGLKRALLYVVLLAAAYIAVGRLWGAPLKDLQASKYPPQPLYLCASLFVVVAIFYYRGRYPKWIVHIGQNSIFYFMGQGIGSSLLGYMIYQIWWIEPWYIRAFVAMAINMVLSLTISELFLLLWKAGQRLIGKWKEALRPAA